MKLTRLLALFLAALMLAGMAACKPSKPIHDPLLDEGYNDPGDSDDGYHHSDLLRVYFSENFGGDKALEQLNDVLRREGFNMEFAAFPAGPSHAGEKYEHYKNLLMANLDQNAVFLFDRYYWAYTAASGDMALYSDLVEELQGAGRLGDFYAYGMVYAPKYTLNPLVEKFNDPGTLFLMPTQFSTSAVDPLSVIVREDIADAYGGEIRTASDYYDLLNWIKRNNPDEVPGMLISGISLSETHELFLPEVGYWAIPDFMFGQLGTNQIGLTYTLPEALEALEEMAQWRRGGLVNILNTFNYVMTPGAARPHFEEYPTMLLHFNDFIEEGTSGLKEAGFYQFDASGYRIYPLYNGLLPKLLYMGGDENYAMSPAIAGVDTDVSEFLRLLEWLGDRENYNLLFNGVEGVDYTLRRGRVVPSESSERDRDGILEFLKYFERSEFKDIPVFAPGNYEDELQSWSWAYIIEARPDDYDEFGSWLDGLSDDERSLVYNYSPIIDFAYNVFYSADTPNEERMQELMDKYIEGMEKSLDMHLKEAAFYEEIIKNATIIYN